MKIIKDIAAAELRRLFFSPVALLLLIIFVFLVAETFATLFYHKLLLQQYGIGASQTMNIYGTTPTGIGLYGQQLKFIYLFFPLLTMNMFSRDMGSGAIKLLLSAPVNNSQIVWGKYLSLFIFSLVFTGLFSIFSIYGYFTIENVDTPLLLSGLLGILLLCCIYSAVGLFMSSLTTHPIVAALLTLTALMVMTFINSFWQEYPVVRDITYWLSMEGRTRTFTMGMISSEDLIYFITLICFFLVITIVRLNGIRTKKSRWQMLRNYSVCVVVLCLIGYITSMPKFKYYLDVTRNQTNTLSPESQRVVSKLDGGLSITTYVNMLDPTAHSVLPREYKKDVDRFSQYLRFKPEISMKYVYYYKLGPGELLSKAFPGKTEKQIMDTVRSLNNYRFSISAYADIHDTVNLASENFRFVRVIERENGQRTFLRVFNDAQRLPEEKEISAAMKKLVEPLPLVGFVTGHGERTCFSENDRGYNLFASDKVFRHSLINNGFDFTEVSLGKPVPANIDILVIADANKDFSSIEMENYFQYVQRGGNLFIAADPGRQEVMNKVGAAVGIGFEPGTIVHAQPKLMQDLLPLNWVQKRNEKGHFFETLDNGKYPLMLNGASDVKVNNDKGFTVYPLFTTDTLKCWNELETANFKDDTSFYNPAAGENQKVFTPAVALERRVNGKNQKVFVTGDADWISNLEIKTMRKGFPPANFLFVNQAFYWLSNYVVPVNTSRPAPLDNKILTNKERFMVTGAILKWGLPGLLLATGLFIWIRRKGR